MRTISRQSSFWVAAGIAAIALWTSAAPTVSYPLYAEQWGLTTSTTTAIFAVYPIVLVVALAIFGNLSDYIGRRAAMLIGLATSFVGVLLFAVAPGVEWLFVGRAFMGLGVALSLSPATAAVLEFSAPGQAKRASAVTTVATAVGLGLATLVGGGLIEYAPLPLRLNFIVLLVVIAAVGALAWFLPRHTSAEARGPWRPRGLTVPRGIRGIFVVGAVSVTAGFALGVIMLSLGADIAEQLVGSDNALVTGAVIALNATAVGIAAIVTRNLAPRRIIVMGGIASVLGVTLLLVSATEHSLGVFLVSAVVMGTGYSLFFSGGLGLVSATAPAQHRAGTLSAVYLVAYFFQGTLALFLGALATASGLQFALDLGAGIIAVFSLGALVLALSIGRRPLAAEPAAA